MIVETLYFKVEFCKVKKYLNWFLFEGIKGPYSLKTGKCFCLNQSLDGTASNAIAFLSSLARPVSSTVAFRQACELNINLKTPCMYH